MNKAPFRMPMKYIIIPDKFKRRIELMLDIIINKPQTREIILFGSCAREEPKDNSDVDLAIIVEDMNPQEKKDFRISIREEMEIETFGQADQYMEVDLYIINKSLWESGDWDKGYTITPQIREEGIVIYG